MGWGVEQDGTKPTQTKKTRAWKADQKMMMNYCGNSLLIIIVAWSASYIRKNGDIEDVQSIFIFPKSLLVLTALLFFSKQKENRSDVLFMVGIF